MNKHTYRRYKKTRFWAVEDMKGGLVAVVVYKKGAKEICVRLDQPIPYTMTEMGRQASAEANAREASRQEGLTQ